MINFAQLHHRRDIVCRMQNMLATQRISHAYIFEGEEGMGKTDLARSFAKALQCEKIFETAPYDACNTCLSCRVFESGNHPDVLYVSATKTKAISVDDVRQQIILPLSEKTFRYRYKIFIVPQAETLTPAAQNALLKSIEDPAPHGIFLLLAAHTRGFLPTVLSRCVTVALRPVSDALIARQLAEAGVPEETARRTAAFAQGNPGRASALAESAELHEMHALALSVAGRGPVSDLAEVYALYALFDKWKDSIHALLDILYMCLCDALLQGTGGKETLRRRLDGLDAVVSVKRALQHNGNFQMNIEWMLMQICPPHNLFQEN
jgi:DNA polymerase-3 subunit delta'